MWKAFEAADRNSMKSIRHYWDASRRCQDETRIVDSKNSNFICKSLMCQMIWHVSHLSSYNESYQRNVKMLRLLRNNQIIASYVINRLLSICSIILLYAKFWNEITSQIVKVKWIEKIVKFNWDFWSCFVEIFSNREDAITEEKAIVRRQTRDRARDIVSWSEHVIRSHARGNIICYRTNARNRANIVASAFSLMIYFLHIYKTKSSF